MISLRKIFVSGLLSCLFFGSAFNADINWDPTTMSYTIPADGDTYYIDSDDGTVTLTMDLTINGTFEVRDGGNLNNPNGYEIEINSGGVLRVKGGNGEAGGDGGTNGLDTCLTNSGTIEINDWGLFYAIGGNGGAGEASSENPVDGGDGGSACINGYGTITVNSEGTLNVTGGNGGNGGTSYEAKCGGYGGAGGAAQVAERTITVNSVGTLNVTGGNGGNGGTSGYKPFYTEGSCDGGHGGAGGLAQVSSGTVSVNSEGILNLTGGNGGNGGNGTYAYGGAGGSGENAELSEVSLHVDGIPKNNITLNLSSGTNGQDGDYDKHGDKGSRGEIIFTEGITAEKLPPQALCDPNLTLSQQLTIDFTWTITRNKNVWGNGNKIVLGPTITMFVASKTIQP